jgi:hypothetical protein
MALETQTPLSFFLTAMLDFAEKKTDITIEQDNAASPRASRFPAARDAIEIPGPLSMRSRRQDTLHGKNVRNSRWASIQSSSGKMAGISQEPMKKPTRRYSQ